MGEQCGAVHQGTPEGARASLGRGVSAGTRRVVPIPEPCASDHVLGFEILQIVSGEAEPLAIDLGVVLAEQW